MHQVLCESRHLTCVIDEIGSNQTLTPLYLSLLVAEFSTDGSVEHHGKQ